MAQQVHVIDAVRAGDHPRDQSWDPRWAFAPPAPFRVSAADTRSARPARWANAIVGAKPAHDTRFGSSKTAEMAGKLRETCHVPGLMETINPGRTNDGGTEEVPRGVA